MEQLLFDSIQCPGRISFPLPRVLTSGQNLFTVTGDVYTPNPAQAVALAQQAAAEGASLCFDVETWPVQWSVMKTLLRAARNAAPNVRLSNYDSGQSTGTELDQGLSGNSFGVLSTIYAQNRTPEAIATTEAMDFVCPSLYMNTGQTQQQWNLIVDFAISQSRQYNRPVYPFISPFSYDSAGNPTLISNMDWYNVLSCVGSLASQNTYSWC